MDMGTKKSKKVAAWVSAGIRILSVIAVLGFASCSGSAPERQCEYTCTQKPTYSMCQLCAASQEHGGGEKESYGKEEDAICRAFMNVNVRKYEQGYQVYECPHTSGQFHLTTYSYGDEDESGRRERRAIEVGKIKNVRGREISQRICGDVAALAQ